MEILMSQAYSIMAAWALLQTLLPPSLRSFPERGLAKLWDRLFQATDSHVELQVEEKPGRHHNVNLFYKEVCIYLSSLGSSLDEHKRLKVCRTMENSGLAFSLPDNETLEDSFEGARVSWTHSTAEKEGDSGLGFSNDKTERTFTLRFAKSDRKAIMSGYLAHVSAVAAEVERKDTQRHLYTNRYGSWEETTFNHPSTFDTLALDDGLAERIKADLDAFSKAEAFYHRNGRVWKRGYLLYGPPGTGKSSMIAAVANYMEYDVYDLELTKVSDNTELKSLLMETSRKSVIVIEDIDCSIPICDRENSDSKSDDGAVPSGTDLSTREGTKITLSGLLNFTDGLWSSCGEERIFIFTTNYKDRLDPALLRAGRMDLHILLSYCSFPAIKKLASNYLNIQDHHLFAQVKDAMTGQPHQLTPAAVAEIMISNQSDPDAALKQVISALPSSSPASSTVDSEELSLSVGKPYSNKRHRARQFVLLLFTAGKGKHTD